MSAIQLDIHSSLGLPSSRTRIPQIGFGVYESPPDKCFNSCSKALEAGYRHIDTAQYYKNEADVGRAIRESNVARKDVHITTKILEAGKDLESTYEKILESVVMLDGKDGYVDLFLIHSPNFGKEARQLMWQALERAKNAGKVLEIGVSNYGVGHIEEIRSYSDDWPPAVNQIELHPWCQQVECVKYCQQLGIVVEAYCPLVRNEKAEDPTLVSISKALKVEPSQVLIRWSLQKRFVPLPKSDTPSRIVSNVDVYNFSLSKHDMDSLDRLDQGKEGSIVAVVSNK